MPDPMITHRIGPSVCPSCGAEGDSATGVTTAQAPKAGDVSICFYCCEILVYADDLRMRRAPDDHPSRTNPSVLNTREQIAIYRFQQLAKRQP